MVVILNEVGMNKRVECDGMICLFNYKSAYKTLFFSYIFLFFRANLSDSYFTNRQDRYVLLENCREVADFFSDLVEAVGDVSPQLQPDDSVTMLEGMVHPYKGRPSNAGECTQTHVYSPTCFDTI